MATIETIQIAVNGNAPQGADAINLYQMNNSGPLTLAQLVAAVCFYRAAILERRSTLQMNRLTQTTGLLNSMSNVLNQVFQENAQYGTTARLAEGYTPRRVPVGCSIETFLKQECQIEAQSLPGSLGDATSRLTAFDAIRRRMDTLNTQSQQETIDMQSTVNWRDVTYNLSSGTISRYATTGLNMANNIV